MKLSYIRTKLVGLLGGSEKIVQLGVRELVEELDRFEHEQEIRDTIDSVLRTVEEYTSMYLVLVNEFHSYPVTNNKKVDKVREILCMLCAVHTYLASSISKYTAGLSEVSEVYKYVRIMKEREEHFKSEKMVWMNVNKSITEEVMFKRVLLESRIRGDGKA